MSKKDALAVISSLILGFASLSIVARQPLTFEERVKAQEAIERVYYSHRIWPKENPGPKPPFKRMVTQDILEGKVTDYLTKSAALDNLWQKPIQPEQLQAEMDRMVRDSQDPTTLKELFAALNNDPYLIAECLARPVVAETLLRNHFLKNSALGNAVASIGGPRYDEAAYQQWWNAEETNVSVPLACGVAATYFLQAIVPSPEATCTENWISTSVGTNVPSARHYQTAVWTGAEMIVWGGDAGAYTNTGGRYNPATDTWIATSTGANCPSSRYLPNLPVAVWTGTEMIIWGGNNYQVSPYYYNTGGRYNPIADSWAATSIGNNVPSARDQNTAVWTGTEMIVWGGYDGSSYVNTGGRYNPTTDSWVATSTAANCPTGRSSHSSVWTGSCMIVWGGNNGSNLNTGGLYNPSTDSWVVTSTGANVPSARSLFASVWTGTEMIVWGGQGNLNTGGRYSPATDIWTPTSTGTSCPSGRAYPNAVWTGTEMIVWGGGNGSYLNTGGRYDLATDTWTLTSTGTNCPSSRYLNTALWTGTAMIIWGGEGVSPFLKNTGGRYVPGPQPINPPTMLVQDANLCTSGAVNLTWTADPGDWNDSGTGTRTYLVYRDGVALATGGCQGPFAYGATSCTDDTTVGGTNYAYRVAYLNTCGGASLTPAATVLDSQSPTPTVTGPSSACAGSSVSLSTQSYASYQWINNGVDIPGETSQNYTALASGSYSVRVTDANACVGTSQPKTVTINPLPQPAVSGASAGCAFPGVTLSVRTFSAYQWQKEGTDISGATLPSFLVTVSGSYSVRVTDGNGCINTSAGFPVTIYSNPPPPTVSGGTSACASSGVTLSTGVYSGYQWRYNGTPISGATQQMYFATSSGNYSVTITDTNGCQSTSSAFAVTIYPLPTPSVTGSVSGCAGIGVNLSTQSFANYQWMKSGTDIAGATAQNYTAMTSGSYSVRVVDSHGCVGTSASKAVAINSLPIPTVSGATSGCASSGVVLGTQSYSSYQWLKDSVAISGATAQSYVAGQSGAYSVSVTDSNGCMGTSSPFRVTVNANPVPTVAGPDSNTCPASTVALSTSLAYQSYQWYQYGIPIAGATGQTYTVSASGDYSVAVTDANGCSGTPVTAKSVTITFCPATEVSPTGALFPARLMKDAAFPSGYYLYFQRIDGASGYNVYEGNVGSWYSHGGAPGNTCNVVVADLGTGEMRAEVLPSTGNHYYLVTAFGGGDEGPSGFASSGTEIPASQSTCAP